MPTQRRLPKTVSRAQLKALLKDKLQFQATFFYDSFLETLSLSQRELDHRFQRHANDPGYIGFLEDEAADLNAFIAEASQLMLVALYHWVERELKGILARCSPTTMQDDRSFPAISKAFLAHDVHLDRTPSFATIEVLRHFANSWKHNPRGASATLLAALCLSSEERYRLSDFAVESALRKHVALEDVAEDHDVIRAFRDRALAFLCAVTDSAPVEFRRKSSTRPRPRGEQPTHSG